MSEKIHCPMCGCVLCVTADEIVTLRNPCDTLTRAHQVEIENEKAYTGTYEPTMIPGCPKDIKLHKPGEVTPVEFIGQKVISDEERKVMDKIHKSAIEKRKETE